MKTKMSMEKKSRKDNMIRRSMMRIGMRMKMKVELEMEEYDENKEQEDEHQMKVGGEWRRRTTTTKA